MLYEFDDAELALLGEKLLEESRPRPCPSCLKTTALGISGLPERVIYMSVWGKWADLKKVGPDILAQRQAALRHSNVAAAPLLC